MSPKNFLNTYLIAISIPRNRTHHRHHIHRDRRPQALLPVDIRRA